MVDSWKNIGKIPQTFIPRILNPKGIENYCSQNKCRLIISACDIDYFESNIESLISYERSRCSIPYIVFILSESTEKEPMLRNRIKIITQKYNIKKSCVELFKCEGISRLKVELEKDFYKEYKINYLRCARFLLAESIWKIMGLVESEETLLTASTYIIDYDNYILDDFNGKFKKMYGDKKAVFCWWSKMSARKDFVKTLSSFSVNTNSDITGFSLAHKCIKAGFTALSPSIYSKRFLMIFQAYSIGLDVDRSITNHRLFSFYYSDQLSMLTALREIRENTAMNYEESTGWIDMSSSILVNLSQDPGVMMWCPKGKNKLPNQHDIKKVYENE